MSFEQSIYYAAPLNAVNKAKAVNIFTKETSPLPVKFYFAQLLEAE